MANEVERRDLWERLGLFLVTHGEDRVAITVGQSEARPGEYTAMATWGREADDSPMVGAAAHGLGHTVEGALSSLLDDANA